LSDTTHPADRDLRPINPSFPMTFALAQTLLRQMRQRPVPLRRPVLFLCGLTDPGLGPRLIRARWRGVFADDRFVTVHFYGCNTFEDARAKILRTLAERFGSPEPGRSVAVDVVGHSVGALVGMHCAAIADDGRPRLDARRIFSLAGPVRCARAAMMPEVFEMTREMRPGSTIYARLERARLPFELLCYARLDDWYVGEGNTAPPGRSPWWVQRRPREMSHVMIVQDQRILADVALRLRGEPAVSIDPPAPLPPANARRRSGCG
jgi:hypothetical protein